MDICILVLQTSLENFLSVYFGQFLGLDGPYLALLGPLLASLASGLTPSTCGNPVSTIQPPISTYSARFFAKKFNFVIFWTPSDPLLPP